MITRRELFGLLGGALVTEAARKIYVLPPAGGWRCAGGLIVPGEVLYFLEPQGWKYKYLYRNPVTGCISYATSDIAKLAHTFAYPELDVMDIYRQMTDGSFDYAQTVTRA